MGQRCRVDMTIKMDMVVGPEMGDRLMVVVPYIMEVPHLSL